MLADQLKLLFEQMDEAKTHGQLLRVASTLAHVAALVEEVEELPPEVFAALPLDARKGCLNVVLGVIANSLQ
jgi:hypothetical protein